MEFYCDSLQKWSIEGFRRDEKASTENARKQEIARKQAENDKELAMRKSLIKNDAHIVQEDEKITQEVQRMMIRYGMVQYEKQPAVSEDEKIDELFKNLRADKEKERERKRLEDEKAAQILGNLERFVVLMYSIIRHYDCIVMIFI